jgi:predicted RNA binding protein YcfA (HicA-like mRNA interferase family)
MQEYDIMAQMPQLNANDLTRLIKADGWVFDRCPGSSHSTYKHPDRPSIVTIAGHGSRPIPAGTIKGIFEAAGMMDTLKKLQKGTSLKHVERQLRCG